jgi:hypothetical protein
MVQANLVDVIFGENKIEYVFDRFNVCILGVQRGLIFTQII